MRYALPAIVLAVLPLAGVVQGKPLSGLRADIARTSYGVVHIRANDFRSLGFGFAQSYAADNICMFADSVLTARGERSRFFGPDAPATEPKNGEYGVANSFLRVKNETSDFFYKGYLDPAALKAGYAAARRETRELLEGYVAGYNRYLAKHAADLPVACRGAPWVRPISVEDMHLLGAEKALHASGKAFATDFVRGGRDSLVPVALRNDNGAPDSEYLNANIAGIEGGRLGSNAAAFGRDATTGGRGILFGNPHYPWVSTDRFYQVHLTVPGKYDAMGVSLGGLPLVVIGFNKDLAWTHTVTYASHFSLYKLALDEQDKSGTTYLVDGKPEKMHSRTVTVERLLPSGEINRLTKTFYFSKFGAVLVRPEARINWSASTAYVLFDPNRGNTRLMDQWLGIGMSGSVKAIQKSLADVVGLAWVNTIAADRSGDTLYADASVVPYVAPESFTNGCMLRPELTMFDGARSACAPGQDGTAPHGIVAPDRAPSLLRTDYVANANGTYWTTNPRALLTGSAPHGYSPLYGKAVAAQSLRTRMGLLQLEETLAGGKKLGLKEVQDLAFSNRILLAEIALPDLLKQCSQQQDDAIQAACKVLSAWNGRADIDSRGYLLFRDFWRAAGGAANRWATPFDPARPIDTPRGLSDSGIAAMWPILKSTVARFAELGIALDARTGDYQHHEVQAMRVPIHGGPGELGAYNVMNGFGQTRPGGSGKVDWGASYVQVVGFDAKGPVATGMLVYGQSTDPMSPHHTDQLPLYSRKHWPVLPFTPAQIKADPAYKAYRLSE